MDKCPDSHPQCMNDCVRGRRVWAVGCGWGNFSVQWGIILEDQEMGRVHMGALELEVHRVNCTDSPRKVRGQ